MAGKSHASSSGSGVDEQSAQAAGPAEQEEGDLLTMLYQGLESGADLLSSVLESGADMAEEALQKLTGGVELPELLDVAKWAGVSSEDLASLERLLGPKDAALSIEAAPESAKTEAAEDADYAQKLEIALEIVEPAGSATKADAQLVVEELVKMSIDSLRVLKAKGTKVVVCRGSVTEYMEKLKGVRPRGWPEGSTWDQVPGLYSPSSNEVVIATIGHESDAGAHVPNNGEGHGSFNLVLHEAMHGVDDQAGKVSNSAEFIKARDADLPALAPYGYLTQAGAAGRQETFAEIGARYFGEDSSVKGEMPNLCDYFETTSFDGTPKEKKE